jgi:hypothetical protein
MPLSQIKSNSVDSTSNLTVNTISVGGQQSTPYTGFKNRIINGNFDIWQRGTSFSSPNGYTADRWIAASDATHTVSRQSFTLGQTAVSNEPRFFLRNTKASGGTYTTIYQRIESVRTLAERPTTVSFWAKGSANATLNWRLFQYFGSGGSPSAINESQTGSVSMTTSWQKFTVNATPQSISGKTLGSDNGDFLYFEVFVATSSAFDLDLAQVQVEEGSVATPFEQRPFSLELQLCRRYYELGFSSGYVGTSSAGSYNPDIVWFSPFTVEKRVIPSITRVTGTITDTRGNWGLGNVNVYGFENQFDCTNSGTPVGGSSFTWAANSEL